MQLMRDDEKLCNALPASVFYDRGAKEISKTKKLVIIKKSYALNIVEL